MHSNRSMLRLALFVVVTGCVAQEPPAHEEESDLDPVVWSPDGKADFSGVPATFDHNEIVDSAVFTTQAVEVGRGTGVEPMNSGSFVPSRGRYPRTQQQARCSAAIAVMFRVLLMFESL